jgi:predicted regulator of Ras-like GTPase activity (Roadblock/LC7/MglB family)
MDLNEPLITLVNKVDGAFAAILTDNEGEQVVAFNLPGRVGIFPTVLNDRVRLIGAYQTISMDSCRTTSGNLGHGAVRQIICRYETSTAISRPVTDDYTLTLLIKSDGNVGQGMMYLNQAAEIIREDL